MLQTDLLDCIAATTKKNEKLALLRQVEGETRELLRLALDPMVTFGLTVDPVALDHTSTILSEEEWWPVVTELAERLSRRALTGGAAKEAVVTVCSAGPTPSHAVWAQRMFNKDLRAGVGSSLALEALPGLYEEFEVFLAKAYDPEKHELPSEAFFEPKLDGLRMVVIEGVAYTRNGHRITSVQSVIDTIPGAELEEFVFDGEILGATFDETSGQVRQQKGDGAGLVYNIFDMINLMEWRMRDSAPLQDRKPFLSELSNYQAGTKFRVVPFEFIENPTIEQAAKERDRYIAAGFEGLMVKDATSGYVWGRSDAMLKFKKMETIDGRVVGCNEGKGKCKGKLGALLVEIDGVATRVGGGFSDQQRVELWAIRDRLPGWVVEVQYQNKTKDGVLRFPVFVKRRPDKE